MKGLLFGCGTLIIAVFLVCGAAAAETTLFSFEGGDTQGWEIPDWAYEKDDYVGRDLLASNEVAKDGKHSLKLTVDFPGGRWNGAIAEVMEYFDWTPYKKVSVDVYVPKNAPAGLSAKIVLTVGDNWTWTEMSRSVKLTPGEWTTIAADFTPGSSDWRRVTPDDSFRRDVRKLDIRVESNKPAYKGPVYIDNIKLSS